MNKVLLTGASGFLGGYICKEFQNRGIAYETLGRSNSNDIVTELGVKPIKLELDYETVVHCAGKAHLVPINESEAKDFFDVNVEGTKNLLMALEKNIYKLKNFVFISTVSVYGRIEGDLVKEEDSLLAEDPYGKSKIICENLLNTWCRDHQVKLTILRIPLLIGKNAPGNLGAMINGMKKGFYFNIDGGHARKSMVLAEDVAKFIPDVFGKAGIFNLTDGYHPSFKELSDEIGKTLQLRARNMSYFAAKSLAVTGDLIGRKFPIDSKRLQKIISKLTFDDQKARNQIGWNPRLVLNEMKNLLIK